MYAAERMPNIAATVRRRASDFRRRHALEEYYALRRLARRLGYHLVNANYYSPIPDLDSLPADVWSEAAEMPGVAWDIEAQARFVSEELATLMAEFAAPADPPGTATGFYLRNDFFSGLDAEILYAMVRWARPRRVLELGAGFSTLVIASAAARNRAEGAEVRHDVFDPFPSPVLAPVRAVIDLHPTPATAVPLSRFLELEAGDILFIDTTHTVKPGSDVIHLLLGALPQVAPGVVIHIHDFYRPFEYPRALMEVFGAYWQEHYLVQAFLCLNGDFDVLCANHALLRCRADDVKGWLPGLDEYAQPSSLWLRRRA